MSDSGSGDSASQLFLEVKILFSRIRKLEVSQGQKCFHLLVRLRNTLNVLSKIANGEHNTPKLSRVWPQGSDAQNSGFLLLLKVHSNKKKKKAGYSDRSEMK